MSYFKSIKLIAVTILLVLLLAFAAIGIVTTYQKTFVKDYDSHLTQKEYTAAVVDQNVNLIFYKTGCPYCQTGKRTVISVAEKSSYPTFYINVESEEGQILVKKYHVKKAATIIQLRDGQAHLYLYASKDHKGKIKANKSAIKEALNG